MRFKIYDTVYVKKDGKSKEVCEIELIDSQEIYYMSDNTSYHVDELDNKKPVNTQELINQICSDKKFIEEVTKDYAREMASKTHKWFRY